MVPLEKQVTVTPMKRSSPADVLQPVAGSFRDPGGRVYETSNRILKTVHDSRAGAFDFVESTRVLDELSSKGWVLPAQRLPLTDLLKRQLPQGVKYVLEVPRLPFVSYPYCWPFAALKAAALLHLDVHLACLERKVTLSDASAYNVQFIGARPVFIDHLSFVPYREGELWAGHRQFSEQFLFPLLLRSLFGVHHNAWYRGHQEGIPTEEFARLLRWRHYFNRNLLTHVIVPAWLQRTALSNARDLRKDELPVAPLPFPTFRRVLEKLRAWINGLEPAGGAKTVWQDYVETHGYADAETELKKQVVREFAREVKPRVLWDIGCNTGEYAQVALESGADYVVGFDADQGALDLAFNRARERELRFLPLYLDVANPSPNQGWQESERPGLLARAQANGLLALALVHHLAIGRNIPFAQLLSWLVSLAPRGVIEFVPKTDLMVQRLLGMREDIFPDYTESCFIAHMSSVARVVKRQTVSSSGRLLMWYERR